MDDSAPFCEIHREMALASRAPLIYLLAAFVVVVLNRGNWPFEKKTQERRKKQENVGQSRVYLFYLFARWCFCWKWEEK